MNCKHGVGIKGAVHCWGDASGPTPFEAQSAVSMSGYVLGSVDMTAGKASSSEGTSTGELEMYPMY